MERPRRDVTSNRERYFWSARERAGLTQSKVKSIRADTLCYADFFCVGGGVLSSAFQFVKEKLNDGLVALAKKGEEMQLQRRAAVLKLLDDESLTCRRCGAKAAPIWSKGDRFRCVCCDNQFVGPQHYIQSKMSELLKAYSLNQPGEKHYDEGIEALSQLAKANPAEGR